MNVIESLLSGIRGAELGQATIYARGTTTLATLFADFEGLTASVPTNPVALDSFGGAEVYVNQLVDVVVQDANGVTIRQFTAGLSAPNIEVRSKSFTGTDYRSSAVGTGLPTNLQAVLDAWLTSAGEPDWNVLFGGASSSIQNALGGIAGLFFNVKSPAYGAIGDNVADDTTAIQAALNAAGAVKGIVFFPSGSYRTTAKLIIPDGVAMWGPGSTAVSILLDHATADCMEFGAGFGIHDIRGLGIVTKQPNNGKIISVTVAATRSLMFFNCTIGDSNHNTGNPINVAGASTILLDSSGVNMQTAGGVSVNAAGSRLDARNSFFNIIAGAYNDSMVKFNNGTLVANQFFCNGASAGTYACVTVDGTNGAPSVALLGNKFAPGAGASSAISVTNANNAATTIEEAGSVIPSGFTFPFTGTAPNTNNPQIQTLWRDGKIAQIASDAASVEVGGIFNCVAVIVRAAAGAGAQTLTSAAFAPPGAMLTVVVFNNSGGALAGDTIFGSGFYAGTPNMTKPANGKLSIAQFRMTFITAGGASWAWVPVAQYQTNI